MRIFFRFLAIVAGILLLINLYGLFRSLRDPDLKKEKTPYRNDLTLTYAEARRAWVRRPGEEEKAYALRANRLVNRAVAHYWKDEGICKYHLRVPLWENYLLWVAALVKPAEYRKYEFRDYRKAIERGVEDFEKQVRNSDNVFEL